MVILIEDISNQKETIQAMKIQVRCLTKEMIEMENTIKRMENLGTVSFLHTIFAIFFDSRVMS